MSLAFGSGVLFATPSGGGAPINFGILQECSIDETLQTKRLYGSYNFPVAVAAGERTLVGKSKFARLSAAAVGLLMYNTQPAVGTQYLQLGEVVPSGATSPWNCANQVNYAEDQGVIYAASGLPLKLIATGTPNAGEYKQTAGAYTFNAADIAAGLLVNYAYTVAASGRTVNVNQALMGPMTYFSARLYQADPQTGLYYGVKLFQCVSTKLTHQTKVGDWTVPEFDFEAFANGAGQVMQKFYPDAA
ncbi:MAG: hypothetical protein QM651_16025 [Rhodoblastus sp.]